MVELETPTGEKIFILDHCSLVRENPITKEESVILRDTQKKLVSLSKELNVTHIINGKKYKKEDFCRFR